MFLVYEQKLVNSKASFTKLSETHLAGCNIGLIAKYLREEYKSASEPVGWHIPAESLVDKFFKKGNVIIIDARPKSASELLLLFKIKNIWGYSYRGWTPILLELSEILIDEDAKKYNKNNFEITNYTENYSVFTFLYLAGTIRDGKIIEKWTFANPSSTNSAFLWPDALEFFIDKIKRKNK